MTVGHTKDAGGEVVLRRRPLPPLQVTSGEEAAGKGATFLPGLTPLTAGSLMGQAWSAWFGLLL